MPSHNEAWKPVYDQQELTNTISRLRDDESFFSNFFLRSSQVAQNHERQGDILSLSSYIPFIGKGGVVKRSSGKQKYWMVLGNTCDNDRDINDAPYLQLTPVFELPELTRDQLQIWKKYSTFRYFYLPAWSKELEAEHFFADLTRPVHIPKLVAREVGGIEAILDHTSWVLLNACLVRYLARADGRNT